MTIRDTLLSVKDQTYTDIEHIIIVGGVGYLKKFCDIIMTSL